jgi:hypothetical protein
VARAAGLAEQAKKRLSSSFGRNPVAGAWAPAFGRLTHACAHAHTPARARDIQR